jgi:hypothetical protein
VIVVEPSMGPWLGHSLANTADEMYLNDNPLAEKSTPLLLTSSEALAGFILGARQTI